MISFVISPQNEALCSSAFLRLSVFPVDNLWGNYGPAGVFIEKKNQPSVQAQETPKDINKAYVFNDITTYFTLLVGIYFPSVTGRWFTVKFQTTVVDSN